MPTYNRRASLARCLRALLACRTGSLDVDVYVIDDGSTDGTADEVARMRQECPGAIRLHYHRQENQGAAAARNRGVHEAAGEWVLFTDDDCAPDSGWILALAGPPTGDWPAGVAAVAGRIAGEKGGNWIARYCEHAGYNRFPKGGKPRFLHFANTANCAYRRRVFLEVGGFEGLLSAIGYEDVDLARRVMLLGCGLEYQPRALVRHYHRDSLRSFFRAYWKRGSAGTLLGVLWESPHSVSTRSLAGEVLDLAKHTLSVIALPLDALSLRTVPLGWADAWGFAWLHWLSVTARHCGAISMTRRLLSGAQSLERTSRMPTHAGTLREAMRAVRRRQREACSK